MRGERAPTYRELHMSGGAVHAVEDLHPYECWHNDRCSHCVREREIREALRDAENNHGDGI